MASLPQCATGPAATATQAARSLRRASGCSSFRSVLLPFDWLLPDPRRNLHGLVSGALLQRGSEPEGYRVYERYVASRFRGSCRGYIRSVSATRAVTGVRFHP